MTTLSDIKSKGWIALVKSLGISGAAMFVMEHETGSGNYTRERTKIFKGSTVKQVSDEIKIKKKNS